MQTTNTILEKSNTINDIKVKGHSFLMLSGKIWFTIAVLGQLIFAYYVTTFYGGSAIRGDLQAWEEVLPHGMISGDSMGNFAVAAHLLLAVLIMVGGPLQFIPSIRKYFPKLHRWNGRLYLILVVLTSIFGLYLVWTRGTVGGLIMHLGISLDAILIITFSVLALRYAMIRKFDTHLKWAMRLFIVVNGVWFFRVGLMFWVLVNQGAVGFDPETFEGPFLSFWTFGQYLLPLLILEFYFFARAQSHAFVKVTGATLILISTLVMAIGIFGATMGMWWPRL